VGGNQKASKRSNNDRIKPFLRKNNKAISTKIS